MKLAQALRFLLKAISISVFVATITSCDVASETKELNVILFGGSMATAIYVAEDAGLFEAENLLVNVNDTPDSIHLMTELVKGTYDIAQASIDNFFAYQAGQGAAPLDREPDLRIVMGGSTMKLDLIVAPDVNSYDDFRGETLGVDALTTGWAFVLKAMLKEGGFSEADYRFVETGNTAKRVDALKSGEYRATLLVGNYIIQAHDAGFKTLDDSISSLGSYQGSSFGVSKAWAESNRETLIAFMRAYMRAMEIVNDESRRDTVVKSLVKHTSMDPAIARKTIDQLTSGSYGLTPKAALDMDGVATVLALRDAYGKPAADLSNLDDFVDLSYYEDALGAIEAELGASTDQ